MRDRLLRGALRDAASAASSETCIDADGLAQWADGTMTATARAAFESHAAGCARCQALVAAMVRTEPPAIARPWWRRQPMAWLMPLAAVAAAAVIVVRLTVTEPRSPLPASQIARVEPSAANRAFAPAAKSEAPAAVDASRENRAPANLPRQKTSVPSRPAADAGAAHPAPPHPAPASGETVAQRGAALPPPPAAQAPALAPPSTPAVAVASPAPAGAAAGALRDDLSRAERVSARAAAPALAMTSAKAQAPIQIASPDHGSQWRIADGAVDRSVDGGLTWQPQSLGIAAAPIRAGAAPSTRVCWLVGAGGLVFVTTDGAAWVRVAFPETIDLVGVLAEDATHATVTAADGRRFTTTDGGRSWRQ
jgi:hypothetical protein